MPRALPKIPLEGEDWDPSLRVNIWCLPVTITVKHVVPWWLGIHFPPATWRRPGTKMLKRKLAWVWAHHCSTGWQKQSMQQTTNSAGPQSLADSRAPVVYRQRWPNVISPHVLWGEQGVDETPGVSPREQRRDLHWPAVHADKKNENWSHCTALSYWNHLGLNHPINTSQLMPPSFPIRFLVNDGLSTGYSKDISAF